MRKIEIVFTALLSVVAPTVWSQANTDADSQLAQRVHAAYLQATANISAPTIRADAVLQYLNEGRVILVDVREDAEIAVSRIPGALTVTEFERAYKTSALPKDKTLVAYCTIGYRSGKFAEKVSARGVPIRNLEGGILAWVGLRGPLVRTDTAGVAAATTTVHVYGRAWNILPPDYKAVW